MPNDSLHYIFLAQELSSITNGKITKVASPSNTDIVLSIRANSSNHELLISSNPSTSRMHLLYGDKQSSAASSFCVHLKKHILGGIIKEIAVQNYERILLIHIRRTNELDTSHSTLVAELMGRRSNILLLDNANRITDCVYKASIDITTRPTMPGLEYRPPSQNDEYIQSIQSQHANYQSIIKQCCIATQDNKPLDFAYNPKLLSVDINKTGIDILYFDSLNQAMYNYYVSLIEHNNLLSKRVKLRGILHQAIKKLEKRKNQLNKQLQDSQDAQHDRIVGELITTNIYKIKYGDKQITVDNYYDNTKIQINLDPQKSPAQNAQAYFKKYSKKTKAIKIGTTQLDDTLTTLEYYHTVSDTIANATDSDELDSIEQELIASGLKTTRQNLDKGKPIVSQPRQFVVNGYKVQIGKNNLQNDLIIKKARSSDIWLHAQKIHGCHAIISSQPKSPPLTTITAVAEIVAFFSKAKHTDKVPVDYTAVKNVSKPRGSAPGRVVYVNQKTLWVSPKPPITDQQ